jgi:hypothetical protein
LRYISCAVSPGGWRSIAALTPQVLRLAAVVCRRSIRFGRRSSIYRKANKLHDQHSSPSFLEYPHRYKMLFCLGIACDALSARSYQ